MRQAGADWAADWFWFPTSALLWCRTIDPQSPLRLRVWGQGSSGADVPLAESPRQTRPSPHGWLIGLPEYARANRWAVSTGRMPDGGGAEFTAAGRPLLPEASIAGGLQIQWSGRGWATVRLVALALERGQLRVHPAVVVPGDSDPVPIPPEWFGAGPVEVLLSPRESAGRWGPTERLVIPAQPPEVHVCFERVRGAAGHPSWVRVRGAATGAAAPVEIDLDTSFRFQEPETLRFRIGPGAPLLHEFRSIGTRDRIRATVSGGPPDFAVRFFLAEGGTGVPVRQVSVDSDRSPLSYEYEFSQASLPAPPADRIEVVGAEEAGRALAREALDGKLNVPPDSPLAVLLALAVVTRDQEQFRKVTSGLGLPGDDPVREFLRRPHEYDLVANDPAVRAAVCASHPAGTEIRSIREWVIARVCGSPQTAAAQLLGKIPTGPASGPTDAQVRDRLAGADDDELDLWLYGLAGGVSGAELRRLLGAGRWTCPPHEIPALAAAVRAIGDDPLSNLKEELEPGAAPLRRLFDEAAGLEHSVATGPIDEARIRAATGARGRFAAASADHLMGVVPAEHRDRVAPVVSDIRQGRFRSAVAALRDLRKPLPGLPSAPSAGRAFRIETAWAEEAARLEQRHREQAGRAIGWALRLFQTRELPEWPYPGPPAGLEHLGEFSAKWDAARSDLRAGPPPEWIPAGLADHVRDRVEAIHASVSDGPVREALGGLVSHVDVLARWLAQPAALDAGRRAARAALQPICSRAGTALAIAVVGHLAAERRAAAPRWSELRAGVAALDEIARDEQTWSALGVRARASGLLPTDVPADEPEQLAAWVLTHGPFAQPAAVRAWDELLLAAGAEGGRSAPTAHPPVRYVLPNQYRSLEQALARSGHGSHGIAQRRTALRDWWAAACKPVPLPDGALDWLVGDPGRAVARGAALARAAGMWGDVHWLTLEDFSHAPKLSELLRPRSAPAWVREPALRRLARDLRDCRERLGDLPRLLDSAAGLDALTASVARLKTQVGNTRVAPAVLRDYLEASVHHMLRRAAPGSGLPAADGPDQLREILGVICRCEDDPGSDRREAALRELGVIRD